MQDEMRCVFGICVDCLYFFVRDISTEEEEGYEIRCLITDVDMENKRYTNKCSHYEDRNKQSFFMTEQQF